VSGAVVYPRPYGAAGRAAAQAVETLALTLWAEAGERPVRAIEALATLVVNRARLAATRGEAARLRFAPDAAPTGATATPWPLLLGRVCQAPFLFACWNPRHPRHAALREAPEGDPALAICRRIAHRAASGILPDPTGGATHWHDGCALPGWALGRVPAAEIGGLIFYRPEG
jgi:N-acetylmuramoyl-L-alanine amidase